MTEIVLIVLMIVAAGAGLWWLLPRLRSRAVTLLAQRAEARQQQWAILERTAGSEYVSVLISPEAKACSAALAMGERRFLAAQAPAFPLSGCDVTHCCCRYQPVTDQRRDNRRGEARREHKILLGALGSDRRGDGDRRKGAARK